MKLKKFNDVKKFQEGGQMAAPAGEPMPAEQPMPAEGGEEQAAMEQIAQMAAQLIQELGPDVAAMLAQAIMEMLKGGAEQAQPVFRKGGKLVRR